MLVNTRTRDEGSDDWSAHGTAVTTARARVRARIFHPPEAGRRPSAAQLLEGRRGCDGAVHGAGDSGRPGIEPGPRRGWLPLPGEEMAGRGG